MDESGGECEAISLTIQRERVSFEAALYGDLGTMNRLSDERTGFVLSRNHFRALTGHTFLSSAVDDMEAMLGRKISPGEKETDSFLVKKAGSGSR